MSTALQRDHRRDKIFVGKPTLPSDADVLDPKLGREMPRYASERPDEQRPISR